MMPTDVPSAAGGAGPREDYSRHLEARRVSLSIAIQRHRRVGNLRVVVLVAGLATAIAIARGLVSTWWMVVPIAAYVWATVRLDRAVTTRTRLERAVAFYERAIARLDGRWAGTGAETGERFLHDAHLYARDLDLFGEASLFELLTSARTTIGEDTLAAWLKSRAAPAVVAARQEAVRELAPRTDLREDLAVLGEDARSGVRAEALAAWGGRAARLGSSRVPVWVWLLSAAGAFATAGLLAWVAAQFGLLALDAGMQSALRGYGLIMFALCWIVTWRWRRRTDGIIEDVGSAAHDLALLAGVLGRLEAERFTAPRLALMRSELDVDGEPPSRRIAALDRLMALVDSRHHLLVRLISPLLLWDLHLVYAIERWRRASGPAVRRWLVAVGEMEALSSLAGYHYDHPSDVFPEFAAGPPCFEGDALGHPLLPAADMVPNDVRLSGDLRVFVVSGSNMSGKSTLLRTVGVNAVLAQAGAPVRARRLRLTPLEVAASIRIEDSLHAGVSRFYAEITRLAAIVRRADEAPPVLFLIDELLHGTNSHDRRIGAEAIVRGLVDRGAVGFVTTHDLALAHVAEALGSRGANVHFEDVIEDGRMRFDYRMRSGIVQHSNAIALMRTVGLDV